MQEEEVGLGIYVTYLGVVLSEGAIVGEYTALGTIEETASLAEATFPIYIINLPDGTKCRVVGIAEVAPPRRPPKARKGKA